MHHPCFDLSLAHWMVHTLLLFASAASTSDTDISYGAVCVAQGRMCRVGLERPNKKPHAICWSSPRCIEQSLSKSGLVCIRTGLVCKIRTRANTVGAVESIRCGKSRLCKDYMPKQSNHKELSKGQRHFPVAVLASSSGSRKSACTDTGPWPCREYGCPGIIMQYCSHDSNHQDPSDCAAGTDLGPCCGRQLLYRAGSAL